MAPVAAQCSFAQVAHDLSQDGFTVARACVDGAALRGLVDEYERKHLASKHDSDVRREKNGPVGADGLKRVVHVSNVYEMPELAHLAADKRLLALASACLGGVGVRPVLNTELFDKPPQGNGSTVTPPHQDNFYFQSPMPGIALWITLEPMAQESGTVRYVKGSHRKGLRFHDWDWGPYGGFVKQIEDYTDEDDDNECDLGDLEPGDVVVHHGLTIHHAPPNLSSKRRRGLVVNYVPEQVACLLADDLYQSALDFRITAPGRFTAVLQANWTERQMLDATSVQCALAGWRGVAGGVPHRVSVDHDVGKLTVDIPDAALHRQAVLALVHSGHAFQGASRVLSLPLSLGAFDDACRRPSTAPFDQARSCAGVWVLAPARTTSTSGESSAVGLRLVTPSGVYVEYRALPGVPTTSSADGSAYADVLPAAARGASAGSCSLLDEDSGVVSRQVSAATGPADGWPLLRHRTLQQPDGSVEEWPVLSAAEGARETWRRLENATPQEAVVLELVADGEGRCGLWVVIGSWFGRVLGRRAKDPMSDVVCKSLPHAIRAFGERWGVAAEDLFGGCEVAFGRVERPGVFRVTYGLGETTEGSLLLDDGDRQLRRDAADQGLILEPWSNLKWTVKQDKGHLEAFGRLKRSSPS